MIVNRDEYYDLLKRIERLTTEERMLLAENILSDIRRTHFVDHAAEERAMDEMMADPGFQRVLNNQDLAYPEPLPGAVRKAG